MTLLKEKTLLQPIVIGTSGSAQNGFACFRGIDVSGVILSSKRALAPRPASHNVIPEEPARSLTTVAQPVNSEDRLYSITSAKPQVHLLTRTHLQDRNHADCQHCDEGAPGMHYLL